MLDLHHTLFLSGAGYQSTWDAVAPVVAAHFVHHGQTSRPAVDRGT